MNTVLKKSKSPGKKILFLCLLLASPNQVFADYSIEKSSCNVDTTDSGKGVWAQIHFRPWNGQIYVIYPEDVIKWNQKVITWCHGFSVKITNNDTQVSEIVSRGWDMDLDFEIVIETEACETARNSTIRSCGSISKVDWTNWSDETCSGAVCIEPCSGPGCIAPPTNNLGGMPQPKC